MKKKIKIAFIKFGGLSAGGTEKFLQTIAAHLNRDEFEVDYYYCDSAPYIGSSYMHPDTDLYRKSYMEDRAVNLIRFDVGAKDVRVSTHDWVNTNFWELFEESAYDLIQTGRAGHPEYPFTKIRHTPIVDAIHFLGGVDNQYNIARVMHITNWSAKKWIRMGGDKKRVVIVSHPIEMNVVTTHTLREELGIPSEHFVYGFHQRNSDELFSPIPLAAYKSVAGLKTAFVILGGGVAYRKQATELKLPRVYFVEHTADPLRIQAFLQTVDVYAHGRKDGEVNSTAMAEALYFGLPIVSHTSPINNGHIECIGDAGKVVDSEVLYAQELKKLYEDTSYFHMRSENAHHRFQAMYDIKTQMKHVEQIYKDIVKNPFPYVWRRRFTQLRLWYFVVYGAKKCMQKLQNILMI